MLLGGLNASYGSDCANGRSFKLCCDPSLYNPKNHGISTLVGTGDPRPLQKTHPNPSIAVVQ